MRFTIAQLNEKAKSKPRGYKDEVLARATSIDGLTYELPQEAFEELALKYRMPTFTQMLANIGTAAQAIIIEGPDLRSTDELRACLTNCVGCPFLIEDGFRCGLCGCHMELKAQFKAWHCPVGKF